MSNKMKISDTQAAVLKLAAKTQGAVNTFPEGLNGGARSKVLRALLLQGLIELIGGDEGGTPVLTDAGYTAIGKKRPEPKPAAVEADAPRKSKLDRKAKTDATSDQPRRSRDNSKQAQVIAMLRREEGTTIAQVCEATGWQAHTVRGTFAGAFKKKLGLTITSSKDAGGERVYRIADGESAQ